MDHLEGSFSLSKLWPEFSSLVDGRFSTNIGLSAFIVGFLFVVFAFSLVYVVVHWYKSTKRIKFFMSLLRKLTTEDLSKKRHDLLRESKNDQKNGELWGEFDETLITSADGEVLYNTVDSSHFFNTSTLAQEITENRLLTAVPAFLTAIGVIGTFAGLQMGLSGLSMSKDVGIDVLRDGIGHLINGASIAFLTSVWGVFASLVFNIIEKWSGKLVRKKISILQERIDYLYPRVNAEEALVKISDYSKNSTEVLKSLAEKIGDKMQEAMIEVSNNIQGGLEDSLNKIMAPAIQSLVSNSNKGVETAMDSLLTRFMDKIGDQGENQRDMLENASKNVNDAMGSLGDNMNGFLEKFEYQQELFHQIGKQNAEDIKNTISSVSRQSKEAINVAVETTTASSKKLAEEFQAQIENQKMRDHERNKFFKEQTSEMQLANQSLMSQFFGNFETQQNKFHQMGKQNADEISNTISSVSQQSKEAIQRAVETTTSSTRQFSEGLKAQIENQEQRDFKRSEVFQDQVAEIQGVSKMMMEQLNSLIENQKLISKTLHTQSESLLRDMERVTLANKEASGEMHIATSDLKTVSGEFKSFGETIETASDALGGSIIKAIQKAEKLTEINQSTVAQVGQLTDSVGQIKSGITNVTDKLVLITDQADKSFMHLRQHQEDFQEALNLHVDHLHKEITRVITEYGERVNGQTIERLTEWNKQTSRYTATMTDAISSLSTVVDEIESKTMSRA